MPDAPFSLKLYRFLLKFYPAGFRDDYAGAMEREFRDELAESSGIYALAKHWIRLLTDLAISIPMQYSRELYQDSRHTLRLWANRPWHTGFAILALAIGIGANTGVFSVVDALLLRSLPFHEADRLALLRNFLPPHDSANQFHAWRQQSTYLGDAALYEEFDVNVGGVGNVTRAHVAQTSWNFFSVLGAQPLLGRGFAAGDDVDGTGFGSPGRNAVVVIGYGLWQQLFGGDPKALGATVRMNGNPLTVVGVAPPGFDFPGKAVVWKPAAFSPGNNGWETVARLKSGIPWPQARAAFAVEAEQRSPKPGNAESFTDANGGSRVDSAYCMYQRCEPLDGPHRGSRDGTDHSLRAWSKPGEDCSAVVHRVPASLVGCGYRWVVRRVLDNLHRGQGATGPTLHAILFGS